MLKTPLYNKHVELNSTIVEFAGYAMPVKYPEGLIEEHVWTRKNCGVFDVSHMGQIVFEGDNLSDIFSKLTPSNFHNIKTGVCKYTVLTNENGGIVDDLIITKINENRFFVVWNASRKHENLKHVLLYFPNIKYQVLERGLIAVQGPKTFDVLSKFPVNDISYMHGMEFFHEKYGNVFLTRTGYTGEIGYEISIEEKFSEELWMEILQNKSAKPIGLGARDSLRLEVGYPLYGNDIDIKTTPIEANISWVISKNHNDFNGSDAMFSKKQEKHRVGILLQDKGVLRAGYEIFDTNDNKIGVLTSGGYSPTLEKSIGQAYLPISYKNDAEILVQIRGKFFKATVHDFSFVKTNPK